MHFKNSLTNLDMPIKYEIKQNTDGHTLDKNLAEFKHFA